MENTNYSTKSKTTAGLLYILLSVLSVGDYYLGYKDKFKRQLICLFGGLLLFILGTIIMISGIKLAILISIAGWIMWTYACIINVINIITGIKILCGNIKTDAEGNELHLEDILGTDEDIVYKELSVLMTSLLSKRELNTFNGRALAFYVKECVGLSVLEESGELDDVLPNFGKGFFVLQTKYETSDIIQRFFAERFLSDIFFNGKMNFEELIHSKAKDIKDIDKVGETIFLLNIINETDPNLYDYTAVHIELLRPISKELDKVKKRWDSYVYDRDFRRVTIFYQEAYKIIEEYQVDICDDICEYVKIKLGLQKVFEPFELDQTDDLEYDLARFEGKTLPLNEMIALKKVLKLASELFGNEVISTEVNQEEYEKHEGKVIQVDFKR